MFRLTRKVRFAVNSLPDDQFSHPPANSFAGYPSLTGAGQYFELAVALRGELNPRMSYLLNIKRVDDIVRKQAVPLISERIRQSHFGGGAAVLRDLFELLQRAWPGTTLHALKLAMSPYLQLEIRESEPTMVRLSQTFEFSASHRLHNPALSDEENRAAFGKCNNPHGHGHNYVLEVTLAGLPDENGLLCNVPDFERIVARTVIDRFDHRNLNSEIPEFREMNPSVENIAMVIFHMLKGAFAGDHVKLDSVTVWETPKTCCTYSE